MKNMETSFIAELVALRHDLHAHPEIAFQEERTAQTVAEALTACGIEVHRHLAKTGVVGVLHGRRGPGPVIGLRADMDALPMLEKNEFAYCSRTQGRMHACGHDGHMTMLIGAARLLAANPDFCGTVCFIFQPAEETEGGARVMIEEGLFQRFPIERVFGLHNWPGVPEGQMVIMAGPVMAGTCTLEIKLHGHGCHAAMPGQGNDTILAGSHLIGALQSVVARNVNPCEAAVVSVTQFHAGSTWNVLPDDAVLRGTVRTFSGSVQTTVERCIKRLCQGIAAAFDVHIDCVLNERYPPTVNSAAEACLCVEAAQVVLGAANVITESRPSMGAEDFAFMLREKPGCYVWLGNGVDTKECSLHNPKYDFNDRIIPLGVGYWIQVVKRVLGC